MPKNAHAASTRSSSIAPNTTTSCRRCARARCTTGPRTPPIRSATSRSRSTAGRRTQASIAASTIRSTAWCDGEAGSCIQELGNPCSVPFWAVPPTPELSAQIRGEGDFRPRLPAGFHRDEKPRRRMSLILKRASVSRVAGEWSDEDYDVLAEGAVVGRTFEANAAPPNATRKTSDLG
jgi:hypothetical protein